MSISLDKIEAQRRNLIEEQIKKAQNANKKIQHNFRVLMSHIPEALHGQIVKDLLKNTDGDINVAIFEQQLRIATQISKKSQQSDNNHQNQNYGEKVEVRQWDQRLEQSPPKIETKKRVIKNNKKK